MLCPKCGQSLPSDAIFCNRCGSSIPTLADSPQPVLKPPLPIPIAPVSRKSDESLRQKVIVTDIHMPFWSIVVFMVQWAIASIPAMIILILLGAAFWSFVIAIFK